MGQKLIEKYLQKPITLHKNKHPLFIFITILSLFLFSSAQAGETYVMPAPGNDLIGGIQTISVEPGDTLSKIAQRYEIGLDELVKANPGVDPRRLKIWSKLTIPTAYILPNTKREGIVINLSERRLYYFVPQENIVMTAPVAIGREGWETPLAKTKVIEKVEHPSWRVPKSIKEYSASKGKILPDVVPPGPDNPLGDHAIRLGLDSYLIHGTNDPSSIGQQVSSGCIRMYPDDVANLFLEVSIGTPVTIINQPYKFGWFDGKLYMEAHTPVANGDKSKPTNTDYVAEAKIAAGEFSSYIDWDALDKTAYEEQGIPQLLL